jgi:kynurenine formamidase
VLPGQVSALDALLGEATLVDLTQPLGPDTVPWPGSAPLAASVELTHERDGAYTRRIELAEHTGTHLDAPAHFAADGARVDAIPLEALVRPAVVLDVRPWVGDDASMTIGRDVVVELERRDGPVAAGAAVLVLTGWDRFRAEAGRYTGPPEAIAFPGLGPDAAAHLLGRGIVGIGIDTLSTDPGSSTGYPVHRLVLPAGRWQLEGLVGLERLPARGAWVVVAPLRLVDGSGTPARVLAIVPPGLADRRSTI